jgi:hypothetical protein
MAIVIVAATTANIIVRLFIVYSIPQLAPLSATDSVTAVQLLS